MLHALNDVWVQRWMKYDATEFGSTFLVGFCQEGGILQVGVIL